MIEADMTEAEWLSCDQSPAMLDALADHFSDRKLRWYACACCRRIWRLLPSEPSRKAIAVAELYADGQATLPELLSAFAEAWEVHLRLHDAEYYAAQAACCCADESAGFAASASAEGARNATICDPDDPELEEQEQAQLLRDIFGNPFHPVALDPAWRTGTVVALAEAIYAERAFDRLPILADALEEAGCTSADLLNHCRQQGEHVRGCWAVDLVLGKE